MEALAEILTKLEHLELSLQAQNSVWLSVSDLVKYLGVSESTIRRLVAKNEIPFKRIGTNGKIVFHKRQIDLWLLSGEKHPGKRARMIFQDLL
ncbi:MAG: helix-turn-helix domain-containing protein [Candidatus Marinimicrobia bacterium]|nr:helix-turn-helix domain-containing protein [Candidatus Neomarinimicrobiota bacterium]